MIKKYRKIPVVIKAIQWEGNNLVAVQGFIENRKIDLSGYMTTNKWHEYQDIVSRDGLKITTLEGEMSCSVNDFIIKGVQGEFYPCKPDIFEQTYEEVCGE